MRASDSRWQDRTAFPGIMLHHLFLLAVFFCAAVTDAAQVCKEDETEILTPYYFKDHVTESFCADLFSTPVPDYYNADYRHECQVQMGLSDMPSAVVFTQSARCGRKSNGTATYRMKICCPGVTSKTVCYTCTDTVATRDNTFQEYHTQNCNVLGKDAVDPIVCPVGQVCYTRVGTYRKVSKGCISASSCSALESNNYGGNYTCRSNIADPHCVYCCGNTGTGICNADMPSSIPYLYPVSPAGPEKLPCDANPCYNGGTCTADNTTSTGYVCACRPWNYGSRCLSTYCSMNPCKNGAMCTSVTTAPFYYTCACRLPYDGQNCTTAAKSCSAEDTVNCKQGSTCYLLEDGNWACLCAPGFVGTKCDMPVKKCLPDNGVRSFTRSTNNIISTRSCQEAYTTNYLYTRYSTSYLSTCRSYMDSWYPGSRYVDGVNGIPVYTVLQVEMVSCEKAEDPYKSWITAEFCCNPCLSNPCSINGYCLEVDGEAVCKCRHGYGGKTCESRLARCYVSGDPHYTTFDGERFHMQGRCRYKLTENLAPQTNAVPHFAVYNKNEYRGHSTAVSYPSYVVVEVYNHTIRIARDLKSSVDGASVEINTGYYEPSGLFRLEKNGQQATLSTDFGLMVSFDGDWIITVSVPSALAGQVDGMCRDYNGNQEDEYVVNGEDYSEHPARDSQMGMLFQVNDPEDPDCTTPEDDVKECTGDLLALIESDDYCGLIRDPSESGIFHFCDLAEKAMSMHFEDCVYDVCAVSPDEDVMKDAACRSLASVAEICKGNEKLPALDWRERTNCSLPCPNNRVYKSYDDACLPTCEKPDPSNTCIYPKTEVCSCGNASHVVNDDGRCVSAQTCGCKHGDMQKQIGDVWLSDDCNTRFRCVECGSCARPVGEVLTEIAGCGADEICTHGKCHVQAMTTEGPSCFDCNNNNPCLSGMAGDYFCFSGDPGKFIQCGAGGLCYEQSCSPGLVWDTDIDTCNWPQEMPSPDEDTCYDCDSKNPCSENSVGGFFCFSGDVGQYLTCGAGGMCAIMSCPSGLVWDKQLSTCNWP